MKLKSLSKIINESKVDFSKYKNKKCCYNCIHWEKEYDTDSQDIEIETAIKKDLYFKDGECDYWGDRKDVADFCNQFKMKLKRK